MPKCMRSNCGECKKAVKSGQKGVQCDWCDSWYHTQCCSIGDDAYNCIGVEEGIKWYCTKCKKCGDKLKGVYEELRRVQKHCEQLQTEIDELKREKEQMTEKGKDIKELEEIKKDIMQMKQDTGTIKDIGKRIDQVKTEAVAKTDFEAIQKTVELMNKEGIARKDVDQVVKKSFVEIMESEKVKEEKEQNSRAKATEMRMKVKEVLEQDKRKLNVVVMGVPEIDTENDKAMINKVLNVLVEEVDIGCGVTKH